MAEIFEDLQTCDMPEARIDPSKICLDHLLWAVYFLRKYPTELDREAALNRCPNTIQTWSWEYVNKIAALKAIKIVWPADNFGDDIWCVCVC